MAAEPTLTVDVLVIGWGKAGKSLAGPLAAAGRRVALVERSSEMYGGTCINIACVPTKDLITTAETRRPEDDPDAFFADAVAARDRLTATLRKVNHGMLEGKVTLIDGQATFTGPHEVRVTAGDDTMDITAGTIIVGTGAVPAVPDLPGIDLPGVYDSTTLQHVSPLPRRLVILGGGYVGLEFASMFAHFGSTVTVLDRSAVFLPRQDRDVADSVLTTLTDSGVDIRNGVDAQGIRRGEDGGLVVASSAGDFGAEAVLVAVGRRAATDGLGLEAVGIATDERGYIVVDEHLRTSVDGVFAVGDVNGGPQFTYVSYDDHRIVADLLLGEGKRVTSDRVAVPSVTFITPPLAQVGLTEAEARESGRHVLVARADVAKIAVMPRPKIVGETHGMVKFLVDADSHEILGATLHCIDAQELINTVALAMRLGARYEDLRDGIWTHPSSTEAFNGGLTSLVPLD